MTYWLAIFTSKIFCLMPRALAEFIGKILGEIFWLVVPKKRKKMACENIMRCLKTDEAEAMRIAKKSSVRFGPMAVEVLRFPVIKKNIDEYVTITGMEYVQEAIDRKKGGVFISAHSGNWELLGGSLASAGLSFVGVAMKQKSSGSDRFINEYRRLTGMHITYKTDVREMFDLMKKGWYIGLIMDQDTNKHDGIVLDFFGLPTNCVPGAASMARFSGAPIYPSFIHRRADGMNEVIVSPAVFVTKTKDKRADIKETTQKLTHIIEAHIRKYPEDWFWLHDRWKSIREEWHIELE